MFKLFGAATPPYWAGNHRAGVVRLIGEEDSVLQSLSLYKVLERE
jgi:hypothetical protein